MRRALLRRALALALAVAPVGCGEPEARRTFIVVGVDGAEWSVIERLWEVGRLPHLRRLAERGVHAHLETAYGKSPVIWTTIATSQPPEVHGITGFVARTEEGDVPVSSAMRRAPALWSVLTRFDRPIAVLGWYATWPAERVSGLMVTDHVVRAGLERRVSPDERLAEIDARLARVRALPDEALYPLRDAGVGPPGERDALFEQLAPEVATGGYELVLVYFRSVDEVSHRHWKYWEPEKFRDREPQRSFDEAELAERRDWIPATYERVDRAVGELVAAAPDANLLVISDHGFRSADHLRVTMDFDALLERLGYLRREGTVVDRHGSLAFAVETVGHLPLKRARLVRGSGGAGPGPEEVEATRRRLEEDLGRLRFASGRPVFEIRQPPEDSTADVEARLLLAGVTATLTLDGRPIDGVIEAIEHYSGGHPVDADGIFVAAGPDLDPAADPTGISIHDVAPTLLYGLGLPLAEDFSGRAWRELFTAAARQELPLRTIASYGTTADGEALASEADEEILDELRALGYLD